MLLKYFYDDKIAHASYMVGCQATGEAIIVDPGRDIDPYLEEAENNGLEIVASTETHIHADFISGSRELAARVGAKLYLSDEGDKDWKYEYQDDYDHELVYDGSTFMVGNIKFEVMHSPGHTPEHISFILTDTAGADGPMGIFTGDFVFVGDIGRPDLLEEAAGIMDTAKPGAKEMYKSVKRFADLPGFLQVWPAHGAGSACGKALGAIPSSTVGYEKRFSWAFQYDEEDEFVDALLDGQPEAPYYFAMMKKLNKVGPPVLGGIPQPEKLDVETLEEIIAKGAKVIDTRSSEEFAKAHIPGTINVPPDVSFTNWVGWILDYDNPFYVIAGSDEISNFVRDLIYIGFDNIGGYFDLSVFEQWEKAGKELQSYEVTTPDKVAEKVKSGEVNVLDVRNKGEWNEGHLPNATHIMLGYLSDRVEEVPTDKPVLIHCLAGGRGAVAASILQAKGVTNVINMDGGYRDWAAADLPIVRNGG